MSTAGHRKAIEIELPPVTGSVVDPNVGQSSDSAGADPDSIRALFRQEFGSLAHGLRVERDPEAEYEHGGGVEPDFSEIEAAIERNFSYADYLAALRAKRVEMIERRCYWQRNGAPR